MQNWEEEVSKQEGNLCKGPGTGLSGGGDCFQGWGEESYGPGLDGALILAEIGRDLTVRT
jgi:hypothetical protein